VDDLFAMVNSTLAYPLCVVSVVMSFLVSYCQAGKPCLCLSVRLRDPIENTIRNLEALSNHLEAVALAKAQEIMEQRQKIEAILHSILPK